MVPADYAAFRCLAGACRHTCCAGWEIDIDSEALARWQTIPGELGRRLRQAVALPEHEGEAAHFRLEKDGRCPMLREDGLCRLILGAGEEALCDICADHPRYRNWFSDRVEIGLGLCCEAAARQTVRRTEPLRLIPLREEPGGSPLTDEEAALLALREELLALLQDRRLSFPARVERIRARLGLRPPARTPASWAALLSGQEILDPAWPGTLRLLDGCHAWPQAGPDLPMEQLASAFLLRHLPGALDDGRILERAAFPLWAAEFLSALLAASPSQDPDTLAELARAFSAEVEYDPDILSLVLDTLAEDAGAPEA